MNDIDIQLDQLGDYPATLTGLSGHSRELASGATAFTSTTGRADSAEAAVGLAEHLGALLGDVGTALDHDAREVGATRDTLLTIDHEASVQLRKLL